MRSDCSPFPQAINGLSEKILVSHYENNYVRAVKRLNVIGAQLAGLDYAEAPVFVINGLKREELVAANSMTLHETFFEGLGGDGAPRGMLADAIARDFGCFDRWRTEFAAMGRADGGGSGWVILAYSRRGKGSSTNGPPIIRRLWLTGGRCSSSTCTSMPITWISAPRPRRMSTPIWKRFTGTMR
jgi:superoxide dismutase